MLSVVIGRKATDDIAEARDWYETKDAGLGAEFMDEIGLVLSRIAEGPERFPILVGDARRALVKRFPYSIYFRVRGSDARIVAVLHQRRDPRATARRQFQCSAGR
jgi:plasmid stabilization system protein ParE